MASFSLAAARWYIAMSPRAAYRVYHGHQHQAIAQGAPPQEARRATGPADPGLEGCGREELVQPGDPQAGDLRPEREVVEPQVTLRAPKSAYITLGRAMNRGAKGSRGPVSQGRSTRSGHGGTRAGVGGDEK